MRFTGHDGLSTRVVRPLLLLALAGGVVGMLAGADVSAAGGTPPLTGSITLVDKQWICSGPVALTSVSVTMTKNANGPLQGKGNVDAVHVHSGCTGTIGQLTVVQYQGDGVKVGQGAHDLVVQSGSVRCYDRAPGKHQDGVQVMGGHNILFRNFDVQCQTANNAAFFVNQGTQSPEVPTSVVCDSCLLSGGGITVRIYHSVASGVRNSVIVAGHLSPIRIDKTSAVNPINVNNTVSPPGSSPTPPTAPPAGPGPTSSSLTLRAVPAHQTLHPRFFGAVGVVSAQLVVGSGATLSVSIVGPSGSALLLLPKSRLGTAVSGAVRRGLVYRVAQPASVPVSLRLSARNLVRGRLYRIRVAATGADGSAVSATIPVRR